MSSKIILSLLLVGITLNWHSKVASATTTAQESFSIKVGKRQVVCGKIRADRPFMPGRITKGNSFEPFSQLIRQLNRQLKRAPSSRTARIKKRIDNLKKRLRLDRPVCRRGPPQSCQIKADSFSLNVLEQQTVAVRLSGHDSCGNTALTFQVITQPKEGKLLGSPPELRYQAAYSRGVDTFSYLALNGSRRSEPAVVTINVQPTGGQFAGDKSDLRPYREKISELEVRHLLDKVAFGGTAELVSLGVEQGLSALVDALIAGPTQLSQSEAKAEALATQLRDAYCQNYNVAPAGQPTQNVNFCSRDRYFPNVSSESVKWLHQMRHGHQLRERLALFWHDHFAINLGISAFGTERRHYIKQHVDLLRRYALNYNRSDGGQETFAEMLKTMHFDGAMNLWLDNFLNTFSEANENYGREITELFALGLQDPVNWKNHYTEEDILGIVRAFAGFLEGSVRFQEQPIELIAQGQQPRFASSWMHNFVDWSRFRWMPDPRSPTAITLFKGSPWQASMAFDHDSITDYILAGHGGSARYLSSKLFASFVHPQPDEQVVSELARLWLESGFDIEQTVRKTMLSAAMFSKSAKESCVAAPLEALVSLTTKLGLPVAFSDGAGSVLVTLRSGAGDAGQLLLAAPSVFGWKGCGVNRDGVIARGEIWLGTQAVLGRKNSFIRLLNEINSRRAQLGFAWADLLPAGATRSNPLLVVRDLSSKLNVQLSASEEQRLVDYLTSVVSSAGAQPQKIIWDPEQATLMSLKIPGLIEILVNHPTFTLL